MGASGWDYTVPYESDYQSALDRLREETFRNGDYLWDGEWGGPADGRPRPESIDELLADEEVRYSGTHSIIDCPRLGEKIPTTEAEWVRSYGLIYPVTGQELLAAVRSERPRSEHLPLLHDRIACARWLGRCTVLYTPSGSPDLLAFWGASGD